MKNPHVMIAYLAPKMLVITMARAWGHRPPNTLVVFLNREDKTFSILDVET